jgi:hypothetical protein
MGLLYLFPVSEDETDYVEKSDNLIIVKSYGLPLIFWGYALAIISVIAFMALASASVIQKLLSMPSSIDHSLAYLLLFTLIIIPLSLISFFFYEKKIIKTANELSLVYSLFKLPFYQKKYPLSEDHLFQITNHLDSPNVAKIRNLPQERGFQNKGYFQLFLITDNKQVFIDRCSKKIDLEKLQKLLQ